MITRFRTVGGVIGLFASALAIPLSSGLPTDAAALPTSTQDGGSGRWFVDGPEEIVTWVLFDPASVGDRLPADLRFVTVAELATGNISWARAWLEEHPGDGALGISFLEIVRADRFEIDGRTPDWPTQGAYALWAARVVPLRSPTGRPEGLPLLILDAWLPDQAFVSGMRAAGHYATFGDVGLNRDAEGRWRGTITVAGLDVAIECTPTGPETGGPGSAGQQVFFPPRAGGVDAVVQVSFSGHRLQDCASPVTLVARGDHPLSRAVVPEPATFQSGYSLVGVALPR